MKSGGAMSVTQYSLTVPELAIALEECGVALTLIRPWCDLCALESVATEVVWPEEFRHLRGHTSLASES